MFNSWHTPDGWNGDPQQVGQEVLQRAETIVTAAPNDEYLPQFVRKALRRHLESRGVHGPRVLLVIWPDRGDYRDLVFSIDRSSFSTPAAYENVFQYLSWFLPDGYQYLEWDSIREEKLRAVPL